MDLSAHRTASGILRIDLGAIAGNHALLRGEIGADCTIGCVVKADAYGLGAHMVVPALIAQGADLFFVATPEEGAAIRALSPSIKIAILGGLYKGAEDFYTAHALMPVLNNLDEISRWRDEAHKKNRPLPCYLQVETGMNRLGIIGEEWVRLKDDPALLTGLDVQLILSHFASADELDSEQTESQYKIFCDCTSAFPRVKKSLANSSGIFRGKRFHFDVVRPGMALYGLNPTPESDNPMNPSLSLHTKILHIRPAVRGDKIGYNATHILKDDRMIATLSLGYADGFLRSGSDRAQLYYQGRACSVLGRISMDLVTVDLGPVNANIKIPAIGDEVEIIGPHQDADRLAASLGTIGYEILTNLGKRWARIYSD